MVLLLLVLPELLQPNFVGALKVSMLICQKVTEKMNSSLSHVFGNVLLKVSC